MKRKWFGTWWRWPWYLHRRQGDPGVPDGHNASLTNVFQYGHVDRAVQEEFDGAMKSDVSIKNSSRQYAKLYPCEAGVHMEGC